jgi:hypothetical protein
MLHTPVQQSVGLKQMSPSDEQHRPPEQPADAQVPPWQLSEQQVDAVPPSPLPPPAHELPSVVHIVPPPMVGMAAHFDAVQMVVQQSVPAEQSAPIGLHAVFAHAPLKHEPEQHSGPLVHAVPAVEHWPPVTAHWPATVSHAPEQQPEPLTHAWPAVPHEKPPSSGAGDEW